MPIAIISKPGHFERNPKEYMALLVRREIPDDNHGKWEIVTAKSCRYRVICPNEHELMELALYLGPRMHVVHFADGQVQYYAPPHGEVDELYEQWLFDPTMFIAGKRGGGFRKFHYNSVTTGYGRREMFYAEFHRGWYPDEDDFKRGRSSPGIRTGEMEPMPRTPTFNDTIAAAVAQSRAKRAAL